MTTINPYIGFNGQCRQAMTFYQECLGGGELNFLPVEGSPIESQCPPAMKTHIMHSTLTKGEIVIMATDMVAPGGYVKGSTISISVNCSSEEQINDLYNKFGEGGTVIDPLGVKFWGGMFGVVNDKYGVTWMFNYNKDQQN
jgi:PhnB protein